MAVHRFRCRLRFTAASGFADWAKAQMDVRYGQAIHLNEGMANQELKRSEITEDGAHKIYECDLPLLDEGHAANAYDTLKAVMIEPWVSPGDSFIEHHICGHALTPPEPCVIVRRERL